MKTGFLVICFFLGIVVGRQFMFITYEAKAAAQTPISDTCDLCRFKISNQFDTTFLKWIGMYHDLPERVKILHCMQRLDSDAIKRSSR